MLNRDATITTFNIFIYNTIHNEMSSMRACDEGVSAETNGNASVLAHTDDDYDYGTTNVLAHESIPNLD